MMKNTVLVEEKGYKPGKFFGWVFLITWGSWLIAAYLSYNHPDPNFYSIFLIPGLFAPVLVTIAFIAMPKNRLIRKDFFQRLFDMKKINLAPLVKICLIMGSSVVAAILISVLFGGSINQLQLSEDFKFSAGSIPVLMVMIIAPVLEEIGWRGYGVDALLSRFNLLTGSLMFGFLWSIWHLPLVFVKNYSMNLLLQENVWFAVNYFVSIIPLGIILNWLYVKSNRSTLALIIFHIFLNFMQTSTQMTEWTSCIQTVVIISIAGLIVLTNKELFFPSLKVYSEIKA